MTTYEIKQMGLTVSRLGFGAMRLPIKDDGSVDYEHGQKMVDAAYAAGVNYYDTAYGYHKGESEVFLSKALQKYPRESYYLADKMPVFFCESESDVPRIFDEQFSRLKTDYIDFYLLHSLGRENWSNALKLNILDFVLQKKKEGKIKYIGFSYHGDFDTFVEVLNAYKWDFVQLQMNYIDWVKLDAQKFNDELIKRNIPLMVMEPVRGGFLSKLPDTALKALGHRDNSKTADIALRWCLEVPNLAVVLSGMSALAQVEQNLETFKDYKPLSQEELQRIAAAREEVFKIKAIPCTGCAYCTECPSGIDIPGVLREYNEYNLYKNAFRFKMNYAQIGEKTGKNCTGCGTCLALCPQGIDIPARLKEIDEEESAIKL